MPVSEKHRVIYFHIPKTAGSSVEELFDITYDPRNARRDLLSRVNTETIPAYQHLLPHATKQLLLEDGRLETIWPTFFKFTVVRNPYDRAVSTYHYLRRSGRFSHATRSFADFLAFAAATVKDIERCQDDERYDKVPFLHHLRPQRHWFRPENHVYDAVLKFESFEHDITELYLALVERVPGRLPRLNVTHAKDAAACWEKTRTERPEALGWFEEAYGLDRHLGNVSYPPYGGTV